MNPNRKLYGRLTLAGRRVSLGYAEFHELMMRAAHAYIGTKYSGQISVLIEVSQDTLSDVSLQSDEDRLNSEFQSMMSSRDDPSPYPGLSMGRVADVVDSLEYKAYAQIASHPDKRFGLTQFDIQAIRHNYETLYPDCAPHFPRWVES